MPEQQPTQSPEHHADPTDTRVRCPFCRSDDVELLSLFGSQLSTDQYYCRACHTPFEHLNRDEPRRRAQ